MKFDEIFVLGAGAIGSVCGTLLSRRYDVSLIGNKNHVDAVNSKGLSIFGDVTGTFRLKADVGIGKIQERTLIIVTTKAYDLKRALEGISGLLRKDTVILVLQNGLGNEEVARLAVDGRAKILRGVTTMAAEFSPGEVRFWNGEIVIEEDDVAEEVARIFNDCMLKTRISHDINKEIWGKLVVNCVVNPLTALFRVRNFEVVVDSLRSVRHQIVRECVAVGEAEGIAFQADLEQKIDEEVSYYTNFSSMCQDIMKGKRTEIDFLNGSIAEIGRKFDLPTPVNETLVSLIKFLEGKNGLSRED